MEKQRASQLPFIAYAVVASTFVIAIGRSLLASFFFRHPIFALLICFLAGILISIPFQHLFGLLLQKLNRLTQAQKVLAIGSSLLCATVLLFMTRTLTIFDFYPTTPVKATLKINATGSHNPLSKSSVVVAVIDVDGRIEKRAQSLGKAWHYQSGDNTTPNDSGFVSSSNQPDELKWHGYINRELCINFRRGLDYGLAQVELSEAGSRGNILIKKDVDLYHPPLGAIYQNNCFRSEKALLFHVPIRWSWTWFLINTLACAGKILLATTALAGILLSLNESGMHCSPQIFSWRIWSLFALVSIAGILPYWLAYYPAIMTNDSINHWMQLTTLKFDDSHPVFYTFCLWLLTKMWHSPALLALANIIGYGATSATIFSALRSRGVRTSFLLPACFLLSIFPATALVCITIWKDVPYSYLLALLTVMSLFICDSSGAWMARKTNWLLFGSCLFGLVLVRANGFATAIVLVVFLAITFKRSALQVILVGLFTCGLAMGFIKLAFQTVKPIPQPAMAEMLYPLQHCAAILHYDGAISSQQKQTLDQFIDCQAAQASFMRSLDNCLIRSLRPQASGALPVKIQFAQLYGQLFLSNPEIVLRQWADSTSLLWSMEQYDGSFTSTTERGIQKNDFHLTQESKAPELRKAIDSFWSVTENPAYSWFFWRPALWLYLLLFFTCLFCIRIGSARGFALLYGTIANLAGLSWSMPMPSMRYLWASLLLMPFFLFLAISKSAQRNSATRASKRVATEALV